MARLLTTGWETGDLNELAGGTSTSTNSTVSVVSSTPTPRGGTYCLKALSTSTTFSQQAVRTFTFAASKTEVWLRAACFLHGLTQEPALVTFNDSAAAAQNCVCWNPATSQLRLRLGGVAGTVLATSSTTMSVDAWHCLEYRVQITSTTVGVCEIWLDGVQVITFSGDNTSTANANVQSVSVGYNSGSSQAIGTYVAFDDLAVNDTSGSLNNARPGDGRVVLLVPTGAGSNTALTRGGTDSGANWSQVDELPPSMTDYVFSATAATRDTYALSDLPSGVASVNVADVIAFVQNSDAGAGSMGLTVKSGSTTNEGSAQVLGATAAYIHQQYETDPATSAAWTVSALNSLEAGVTVR